MNNFHFHLLFACDGLDFGCLFFCTGAACKDLKLDQYQSICFGLGYPASASRLNLQLLLRAWLIVPTSISSCIQYLFGTQIPASSGFSATLCCMSSMAVIMIVELHCYVTLFYWERNVCTYEYVANFTTGLPFTGTTGVAFLILKTFCGLFYWVWELEHSINAYEHIFL